MTEVNKAAEHPLARFGMQVLQAILIAVCIGTYTGISGSLKSIEGALNTITTEAALQKQRLDSLERTVGAVSAQAQSLGTDSQRHTYDIEAIKAVLPRKESIVRDKSYR